jgi:ABC-2 type transport system permease protein
MRSVAIVTWRELTGYFASPLAYIFIVVFLALCSGLTFYLGDFFQRGQADLTAFFMFHPWLYLMLMPAIGMRLWAEERKSGTIELLMTMPVTTTELVLGKFLAAWLFAGIALLCTTPMWFTVNYLGAPDNGVILGAYVGSWVMAGAFIAISGCISALTKNQVTAFVVGALVCFFFLMSGVDLVQAFFKGWAPDSIVAALSEFSFLTVFNQIIQGVIALDHLLFLVTLIGASLAVNTTLVDLKKAA